MTHLLEQVITSEALNVYGLGSILEKNKTGFIFILFFFLH